MLCLACRSVRPALAVIAYPVVVNPPTSRCLFSIGHVFYCILLAIMLIVFLFLVKLCEVS